MMLQLNWSERGVVGVLLACALLACGDDDSAPNGEDGGPAVASDGGGKPNGMGARDGGTRPGPGVVTAVQGIAGACLWKFTLAADQFGACDSFDRLEDCARLQCDLDLCVDQCVEYATCLAQSKIACDEACVPESGCYSCMSDVMRCVLEGTCLDTIVCADRVEGGYCDQLQVCCAGQPEGRVELCDQLAAVVTNVRGEASCLQTLEFVGTVDAGFTACPIADAGPPR